MTDNVDQCVAQRVAAIRAEVAEEEAEAARLEAAEADARRQP